MKCIVWCLKINTFLKRLWIILCCWLAIKCIFQMKIKCALQQLRGEVIVFVLIENPFNYNNLVDINQVLANKWCDALYFFNPILPEFLYPFFPNSIVCKLIIQNSNFHCLVQHYTCRRIHKASCLTSFHSQTSSSWLFDYLDFLSGPNFSMNIRSS